MPTKAQAFAQLAEDTATRLTSSLANWTGFLGTVGRLYKYPYHEQLMIYAQRPDATDLFAVALRALLCLTPQAIPRN